MAKNRWKIDPVGQEQLGEVAAELRQIIYGEQGFPEWGTIEDEGMAVGLESARLLREQSVGEQATHMPEGDLDGPEETAQRADTDRAELKTQAGDVEWDEPAAYLRKSRKDWGSNQARRPMREEKGRGR